MVVVSWSWSRWWVVGFDFGNFVVDVFVVFGDDGHRRRDDSENCDKRWVLGNQSFRVGCPLTTARIPGGSHSGVTR